MQGSDGPIMPVDSHVRVVHPEHNAGHRMLRRGYNFVDGSNAVGGSGCRALLPRFRARPRAAVRADADEMAQNDASVEYLRFTGSALFAVPPGVRGPDD